MTEDYVSFETAKLLKEKGFCNIGTMLYKENGDIVRYNVPLNNKGFSSTLGVFYEAPTLQMAMKWLREKYNLNVEICLNAQGYEGIITTLFNGDIKITNVIPASKHSIYEEACEAAIKYCLENLI